MIDRLLVILARGGSTSYIRQSSRIAAV